jgi:hypothetical protein
MPQQLARDEDGDLWDVSTDPPTLVKAVGQGRVFSLAPNPKDVRQEARAAEDQQMQRDNAVRAERAADRADKTAQRQAAAAEKAANAAAKPTEYQSKSAGFLGRMMQAERDFGAVPEGDRGGRSLSRQALHNIAPGLENTLLNSADRQKADQAIENFIAASLRQESGAAISAGEFDRQYKIFFPAPGDSPEVIRQKAEARRQAIEGFRVSAGPLADAIAGKAEQRADNEVPDPTTGAEPKPPTPRDLTPDEQARFFSILRSDGPDKADEYLRQFGIAMQDKTAAERPYSERLERAEGDYAGSYAGQALSGANEGLAAVLGAPADLATAAINLVPKGINALANTNIPEIEKPFLGSQHLTEIMKRAGSIAPAGPHPFVRRVGESIGAAAVPLAGPGLSLGRYGAQLLAGAGGGIGAATAQQAFPDNPVAEIVGELAGGGAAAGGILRAAKRGATRQAQAAVPSVDELKEQARELYRAAESRGVVANPAQTQQLAADFRGALADEGRISPTGRVSEVYPKAREAVNLIDDYAGHEMTPTQIQNVRGVVSDALTSPERTERRLGGILTDVLDQWANPLAPELSEARDVASRYLTAEQLGQARELAGARASQFTGSGFENALRTEYRNLDRGAIKGNKRFSDDVTEAIEKVARGTPTSNFFRGLGRLAPTGPVSGLGSIIPGMAVGAASDPLTGGLVGATLAGTGIAGRGIATNMGIKAADEAELIARNGGNLPPPVIDPEWLRMLRLYGLAETANHLPE